ncbi:FAD binding domain-containing protein [Aquabacter sp. L1I39]|uniref:FAD binding domain-containing protein n=1 Tax=Aquabacter sp. L1I39 TaxID=2820278 RepID=UPI001ADA8EB7|nr:FAD binding domain-containing protein [Aquabacter sp. L1I39]QTL05505.1 FAD binding domain-containing protein [Aquabacter sp. L1I39]
MDLNTVKDISRPSSRPELDDVRPGDAWLAGGTWLFSEPQPNITRLVDLSGLNWGGPRLTSEGLDIPATTTIADLNAFAAAAPWPAAPLFGQCCAALLASFKIWNMATVGGNLCMALPAGAMISLTAALNALCLIWSPGGGERQMAAMDFVRGPLDTALAPGEVLRAILVPHAALARRTAMRKISLSRLGRSAALVVGTQAPLSQGLDLTITASTPRPVRLAFAEFPDAVTLRARLDAALPPPAYHDDIHGRPDWRRHVTAILAEEVRAELAGGGRP